MRTGYLDNLLEFEDETLADELDFYDLLADELDEAINLDEFLDQAIDEAIADLLTSSPVSNKPTLRRGSRGATVVELQNLLTQKGFPLQADGIFGSNTETAVRNFQRRQGLRVDGIVGANTWTALLGGGGTPGVVPTIRTSYFKDDPSLRTISLSPTTPITINPRWPQLRKTLASTYNRLGGLIRALANRVGIEIPAVLAVWQVESAGRRHVPGRAIIRFENHLFYKLWGQNNPAIYDRHFRHGGHAGQPGRSWENHQFRERINEPFRSFHGNQDLEYRVLFLAQQLGGETAALQSISIGGPQILVSNYRMLGYTSPREMYEAFQSGERFHILGFFDFCTHHPRGDLLRYLRNHEWRSFAYYYNGSGKADEYGQRIQRVYQEGRQLPI
jgi:peptidoglycan hydrolase-like protein with peptidoglycan-binding domain